MTAAALDADRGKTRTLMFLIAIVAAMIAIVAASPTLYRLFCEATGIGGTTQRAERAPGAVAGQISVRFDANKHPGLPWRFEPVERSVVVSPGAQLQVMYRAENLSNRPVTGRAVYNVSPERAGKYFNKIQCFCFTEQTLQPGQKVDMPVLFFIDPAMLRDKDAESVHEITLSYTFYPVETGKASR